MGYSIEDLKKAGIINGEDALIVQQSGITKQIARSVIDQAVVITETGAQSTGVIRKEGTYVLQNNSAEIRLSVQNAIGKILNEETNVYTDSASAAAGWIIKILNNSTRNHTVIYGANSWTITAGEIQEYYWTGSAWTFHNIVTEKKLNNALANYMPINERSLNEANNFNDVMTEGHYTCYPIPQISNAPTTTDTYGVLIVHKSSVYILQELTTPTHKWQRIKTQNAWSNWEKVTTETELNNALANFDKIITETDANNCLGDETKEVRYFLNTNASNIPSSLPVSNIFIDVNHIKLPSGNRNIFQTLYIWNANKIQKMYTRTILGSGTTYTYSEWEKIVSETDLNNALANYDTVITNDTDISATSTQGTISDVTFKHSKNISALSLTFTPNTNINAGGTGVITFNKNIFNSIFSPRDVTFNATCLCIVYGGDNVLRIRPINETLTSGKILSITMEFISR